MIKYNLTCKKCNNLFDSWFPSSKEYEKFKKLKHLNCYSCNSLNVEKTLMSPNILNVKKNNIKTLKSYAFAIIGAEYVLRWLPIGTHDWDKFVKPEDLIKINKENNLKLEKLDGMKFNLLTEQWSLSSDNSVNYITKFKKN